MENTPPNEIEETQDHPIDEIPQRPIDEARKVNPEATKKKLIEEAKFEEIKKVLGSEIIENFDSSKWEDKKQALEEIGKFIKEKSPNIDYKVNELYAFLKYKFKDFKESNFNLIREVINIFTYLIKNQLWEKSICWVLLNSYHDKIADLKLKEQIYVLLNSWIDVLTPGTWISIIITKLKKKANVKLLIEYSLYFGQWVDDCESKKLPILEIVELCKIMAGNSNPTVRQSATTLLCTLYKYNGKDIKTLIKDIKEHTLKLIEEEFDKITVVEKGEIVGNNTTKEVSIKSKDINEKNNKKTNPTVSNEWIPRSDISNKISAGLLKDIKDGKWPEKKEACDTIDKIINEANAKILPNGWNDLFSWIKLKLSDGNKNLVRIWISLLTKLIEALGSGFKQYSKSIALALIPNFSDKMQMLRGDCQNCLDQWVQSVGFDNIVIYLPQFFIKDNYDSRVEIMKFLNKHKDKFTKSLGESLFNECVPCLMGCLQDKALIVRNSAEDWIKFSLRYISLEQYYTALHDFKPVIANGLKHMLDKIQIELTEDDLESDSAITNITEDKNTRPITRGKGLENKINSITSSSEIPKVKSSSQINKNNNNNNLPKTPTKTKGNTTTKIQVVKKPKSQWSNDDTDISWSSKKGEKVNNKFQQQQDKMVCNSTVLKSNSKASKDPSSNFHSIHQVSRPNQIYLQPINVKTSKEKRVEIDKKYKFSWDTLTSDSENKIKDLLKGLFTEDFNKKWFSNDFKQTVDALNSLRFTIEKEENISVLLEHLDLILKGWGCKFGTNQNPSMLKAWFNFLDIWLTPWLDNKYIMNETEMNIIIYMLVDKLSLVNISLKEHLITLINRYFTINDSNKAMWNALNYSLGKNLKIKSEILDVVTDLYLNGSVNIANKQFARLFSKFWNVNDNNIKAKVVSFFKEIYTQIGDDLWSYIDINEAEREFLETNWYDHEYDDIEEEYEQDEEDKKEQDNGNNEDNGNSAKVAKKAFDSNNSNDANATSYIQNNQQQQFSSIQLQTSGKLKDKEGWMSILLSLLVEDSTIRLNTIIIVHDLICTKYEENATILQENVDSIITVFITAIKKLFNTSDINQIPMKFAKYLATVLCKIASNKVFISRITYKIQYELSEELLSIWLIENLDKIGDNQEGNIIFKSWNSTMLRILENCNSTNVMISWFEIVRLYLVKEDNTKLPGLAIKCLLKVNQNKETIIPNVEMDKILLQIHIIITEFEKINPDLQPQNPTHQMIIKYIKNFINDIVKIKRETILTAYNKSVGISKTPDNFILKWIKSVLTSLQINQVLDDSNGNAQVNNGIKEKNRPVTSKPQPHQTNNSNKNDKYSLKDLQKKWNNVNKKP